MTSHVDIEILSQPDVWRRAASVAEATTSGLPITGERVAFTGCGTSWFVSMVLAARREELGYGETDAFVASEFPRGRTYDRVVAISRSGTTTEVIELLRETHQPTTLITAVPDSRAAEVADEVIVLDFADESSVVQTRFATAVVALLRAAYGDDLAPVIEDARAALEVDLAPYLRADQCTFIGTGWSVGLAHEAALKTREAAQFWAESYPAMDYRHGPIAIGQPGRLVWSLGGTPPNMKEDVEAVGATFVEQDLDPLASLVVAQRFAVALAHIKGLDPDRPRSLTRSVILP